MGNRISARAQQMLEEQKITPEQIRLRREFAQRALRILQEDCGLTLHDDPVKDGDDREYLYLDPMRYQFEDSLVRDDRHGIEFRFVGGLGFGGKFHLHSRHFSFPFDKERDRIDYRCYVGTYPECETPERLAMIEKTNARLSELADEYAGTDIY